MTSPLEPDIDHDRRRRTPLHSDLEPPGSVQPRRPRPGTRPSEVQAVPATRFTGHSSTSKPCSSPRQPSSDVFGFWDGDGHGAARLRCEELGPESRQSLDRRRRMGRRLVDELLSQAEFDFTFVRPVIYQRKVGGCPTVGVPLIWETQQGRRTHSRTLNQGIDWQ